MYHVPDVFFTKIRLEPYFITPRDRYWLLDEGEGMRSGMIVNWKFPKARIGSAALVRSTGLKKIGTRRHMIEKIPATVPSPVRTMLSCRAPETPLICPCCTVIIISKIAPLDKLFIKCYYTAVMNHIRAFRQVLALSRDYKLKRPICSQPPFRMWIDLTTVCNLRCPICPQSVRPLVPAYMDFNLYKKIIDEIKEYVFDINLAVIGESLLHPRLSEMIAYAQRNRVITRLHTNATILSEELGKKIIGSGLSFISFSVDGFDKESYEKVRVGARYETVVANIRRFLELKKHLKSRLPYVVIKTIVNPDQLDTTLQDQFQRQFKGLRVNRFRLNPMHNFGGKITNVQFAMGRRIPCYIAWFGLTVLADGRIVPCCMDFWGDYVLGDVKKDTLYGCWNSEKMVALRQKLIQREADELALCKGCYFTFAQKGLRKQPIKDAVAFLKEYFTITR